MKPTIINLLFACILFTGNIINKPLLKLLLGGSLKLQDEGWNTLTKRWIGFFIFLAILNEIMWRTHIFFPSEITLAESTDIWVKFKVFGILPLTFIFTLTQFSIIRKYQIED